MDRSEGRKAGRKDRIDYKIACVASFVLFDVGVEALDLRCFLLW